MVVGAYSTKIPPHIVAKFYLAHVYVLFFGMFYPLPQAVLLERGPFFPFRSDQPGGKPD